MMAIYFDMMKKREEYIKSAIPYILLVIACFIVIRFFYQVIIYYVRKKKEKSCNLNQMEKTNFFHELGILTFLIYIVTLFFITIFLNKQFGRHLDLRHSINVIPINRLVELVQHSLKTGNIGIAELKIIGNMALYMPIGFFVPLLWNLKDDINAISYAMIVSIFVELCQLFLKVGADVDNIILNSLGALLGYLLYTLCYKVFPQIPNRFKKRV